MKVEWTFRIDSSRAQWQVLSRYRYIAIFYFCPITLLNTVYKIASGSIANRVKKIMNKLISTDQTGFMEGRYIGENTRLLYDIMQYTEEQHIPGLLLLIDFEKAFDSLS